MADDYSINAKINADSSGFAKGIKNAQSSLTSFSKGIASVTKSLMGLFAIQNFGSFIKSIENIATSFDDARSQIVKGTGATGQTLENLSKSVENSLRMGVGRSAEEIGSMIADLNTRFGVTGQELENLVDEFDMFASVTGQDTKTAIESVADVMLKWNVETEQADELLDQLTVASQASGASVEELESGLKRGQTTFKQFGMSVTKSTAFLASLKKNGIDSGTALAGLRVALVNFTKDGRNAETAFKEITEQIKNASTESEALNIAIDTFGSRMGAEMVKVFRDGGESVDEMAKALMGATGALKESDEASRTTKDAFEDLKAVFTSLFAGMNGVGVRDLIDDVAESLKSINIESVRTSIGNFVSELKTLALNVGAIIKTIFDNFKELFTRLSEMLGLSTLTFDDWKESVYEILDNFYRIIQDAFGLIFAILDGDWSLAWEYAKLVVLRTVESVIKSLDEMTDKFKDRLQKILMIAKASSLFLPKTASIALEGALTTLQKITSNTDKERTVLENAIAETEANIESMTGKSADVQLKALERIGKKRATYVRDFEAGEIDIQSAVTETTDVLDEQSEHITDWDKKLLKQRLDNLDEWSDEYLETQIKIIEADRDTELKNEHSAEEILKINEYYNNEIEEASEASEKAKREHVAETVKIIAGYMQSIAKNTIKVFKNVISSIKSVVNKGVSLFKGLFDINLDDALTNLLKVEDAILTFFVETLPNMPSFFASAVQSIVALLNTLINIIDWNKVQEIINSIIDVIIANAPTIVKNLLELVINIMQTLLNAIIHFVESGGWKMILDMLLTIQKRIEGFVVDNIDEIVNTITDMIPDLVETLKESIVSASKTLGKIAPKILPMIADLINGIVDVITSDEVIDSANEAVEGIVEGLVEAIIKLLPNAIMKILNMAIKLANPQRVGKLVVAIVKGLVKAFQNINWLDVVVQCFMGFIDGFKELFGIHSPSTLFESFGQYIIEGLVNGLKGIAEAVNMVLEPLLGLVSDVITNLLDSFVKLNEVSFKGLTDGIKTVSDGVTKLTEISFTGISDNIKTVNDGLSGITKITFDGLNKGITAVSDGIVAITDSVTNLVKALGDLIEKAGEAVKALNPLSGGGSSGTSLPGSSSGTSADDPWDWADPLHLVPGHANGSNAVSKGLALVGEAGPELVRFRGGEQVLNNRNTNKALAEMGKGSNTFNVTFNNLQDTTAFAMMQQLKAYNRQMAINGIM